MQFVMEQNKNLTRKQSKHIRIKKVCKHANPLFEKWLLEWAEEASKRNSNMKYNFQRAVASLRRYPIPLHSGKECLLLAHFGDKICKLIDKKLEEFVNENGPINWDNVIKIVDANNRKKVPRKKSQKADSLQEKLVLHPKDSLKLNSSGNKGKQYIPAYRSGSYALILALFCATKGDKYSGYSKKNDLIDAAQEFCDASFAIPPSGSLYTAWSSMSTLIHKNFVIREGNPSRYSLTEAGKNLGLILENYKNAPASQNYDSSASTSNITSIEFNYKKQVSSCELFRISKSQSNRDVHNISASESDDESPKHKYVSNSESSTGANAFSSASASGSEVILLSDDEGEDKDECFLGNVASKSLSGSYENEEVSSQNKLSLLSVENPFNQSQSRIISPANDSDEQNTSWQNKKELKFTFIDCSECETLLKDNAFVKIDPTAGTLMFLIKCKLCDLLNTSLEYEFDESRTASPGYTYAYLHDSSAPDFSSLDNTYKVLPDVSVGASYSKNTESSTENLKGCNLHLSKKPKISPPDETAYAAAPSDIPQCSYKDIISTPEENTIDLSNGITKQLFSFLPDQFKIILCVDNMEVTGGYCSGKKGSKDIIINELKSNGVDFDVRKLSIGDFLWICQEKFPSGNKCKEIVLPFIVERKRMDDLAASIRDGRFREQKFRLKKSGLINPIYLVEEIGSNHLSIPLSTCEQAFTNTQFIDSFTVKVTADQRESAAYLTVMTGYLQQKYKHKVIDCLEMNSLLDEENIMKNIAGPSFDEFNNFSIKNKILSVQDIFAKHLLQLSGNSVDKVTAIIRKYPTPALLREALENLPSNRRDEFLSSLKCPKSGRPIGSTISSQLARLYSWTELA